MCVALGWIISATFLSPPITQDEAIVAIILIVIALIFDGIDYLRN